MCGVKKVGGLEQWYYRFSRHHQNCLFLSSLTFLVSFSLSSYLKQPTQHPTLLLLPPPPLPLFEVVSPCTLASFCVPSIHPCRLVGLFNQAYFNPKRQERGKRFAIVSSPAFASFFSFSSYTSQLSAHSSTRLETVCVRVCSRSQENKNRETTTTTVSPCFCSFYWLLLVLFIINVFHCGLTDTVYILHSTSTFSSLRIRLP